MMILVLALVVAVVLTQLAARGATGGDTPTGRAISYTAWTVVFAVVILGLTGMWTAVLLALSGWLLP